MGEVLQKVKNCKQVKGIATKVNSEPSASGRRTSGKPAFLGGGEWVEKVHRQITEQGDIFVF